MAKISKTDLKERFKSGSKPTEQDWHDLFDSFVHLDDQTAINQQVVNTKISTYDTALKSQNPDGTVNTLGDVFAVFEGYSDGRKIQNELSWAGLPGKPAAINLAWTEQTIATDSTTYNPLGSVGSPGAGAAQRWALSGVGGLTGNYLVIDVKLDRHWYATSPESGYYLDAVIAVKVAITPKINL